MNEYLTVDGVAYLKVVDSDFVTSCDRCVNEDFQSELCKVGCPSGDEAHHFVLAEKQVEEKPITFWHNDTQYERILYTEDGTSCSKCCSCEDGLDNLCGLDNEKSCLDEVRNLAYYFQPVDSTGNTDTSSQEVQAIAPDDMARALRDIDFYRGLLVATGELLDLEVYTSDDGSIQDKPLVVKIPELVVKIPELVAKLRYDLAVARGRISQLEAELRLK